MRIILLSVSVYTAEEEVEARKRMRSHQCVHRRAPISLLLSPNI